MAPGAPTQLPDGTVMLPRVTVKISRLTYLDYVHADSYALIGNLLNLVGVPALGDLALAYRAQIYGNRADRDDALAMAVIGGALTVAPARGGVLGRIGAGRAAHLAAGKTVLGSFPEYTRLAGELGARRFSVPTSVWNKMTDAQRWVANQRFLDRMIRRGDDILLATPLEKVRPGSYFQRELDYLFGKGYRLSPDGTRFIRPGGG
jgi:hypothetical protein